MSLIQKRNNSLKYILFIFTATLYSYVALTSYGFDDEFHNIRWIEKFGIGVFNHTQTSDVHPPLSYLLNYYFFQMTNSWSGVRLINTFILLLSFVYAFKKIESKYDIQTAIIFYLLLCLNPGFLLYLTSLRWYAYALPLIIWLLFVPSNLKYRWIKLFSGFVILGYINYIAFVLFLPYFLLYWNKDNLRVNDKIKNVIIYAVIGFLLYLPQLYIFVTVHLSNSTSQVSNFINNIIGYLSSHAAHIGAFPMSMSSVASGIALLLLYGYFLKKEKNAILKNSYFKSYVLTILFFFFSGLAGKFRNLMVATPLHTLWLIDYIHLHKKVK